MTAQAYSLDQITPERVERNTTGYYDSLDVQFGGSGPEHEDFGMPLGKITLFAGSHGIGKSRFWVHIAKKVNSLRCRVMYFQGEMTVAQFVSEKLAGYKGKNFWVSNATKLEDQLKLIEKYSPQLVIVDSINSMDEYRDGMGAKLIIEGEGEKRGYRSILNSSNWNCHVVFLAQMNKNGQVKGRTELPHYVDIEFLAHNDNNHYDDIRKLACMERSGYFIVEVGKNRYGESGTWTMWEHTNEGVSLLSSWNERVAVSSEEMDEIIEQCTDPETGEVIVPGQEQKEGWFRREIRGLGNLFRCFDIAANRGPRPTKFTSWFDDTISGK